MARHPDFSSRLNKVAGGKSAPASRPAPSRAPATDEESEYSPKVPVIMAAVAAIGLAVAFVFTDFSALFGPSEPVIGSREERLAGEKSAYALFGTAYARGSAFAGCNLDLLDKRKKLQPDVSPRDLQEMLGGPFVRHVSDRSQFLKCVSRSAFQKLCDADVRVAFVVDVKNFLGDHDAMAIVGFASGSLERRDPRFIAAMAGWADSEDAPAAAAAAAEKLSNKFDASRTDVIEAVRELAAKGLIQNSDFSLFTPKEIRDVVATVKIPKRPCA
jgi:hypothetical protein